MSIVLNLLCCRELKRRNEKREKEARKAQKAAAAPKPAAPAPGQNQAAAEEELTPNVCLYALRLILNDFTRFVSNISSLEAGKFKSFAKRNNPILTLINSLFPSRSPPISTSTVVKALWHREISSPRKSPLPDAFITFVRRDRTFDSMIYTRRARKCKLWQIFSMYIYHGYNALPPHIMNQTHMMEMI